MNLKSLLSQIWDPDRTWGNKLQILVRLIQRKNFRIFKRLRIIPDPEVPRFVGWGMTSKHALPWDPRSSTDITGLKFLEAENNLLKRLSNGEFVTPSENAFKNMSGWRWRHYFLYWSATLATRFTKSSSCNFVEAGVWEGMTVYFAASALKEETGVNRDYRLFLYDAWDSMKSEYLTTKELGAVGNYSYLSLDRTKANLKEFEEHCEFVKGYIPEIFSQNPGPSELSWLHIDLNSSMPTQKTLEEFVPKLLSGGVVIFDDYGHGGFDETKKVADEYFSKKDGILMPLPTGQAIFFKS